MTRRVIHVLGFWLWIGFSGGAGVLLLVAAPLESFLAARGASRGQVDIALSVLALAWVAASFLVALCLEFMPRFRHRKAAIHVAGAVVFVAVFIAFVQAGSGVFSRFRGQTETWSDRFTFGPYPDAEDCRRLRGEGYSAIVSLLNPIIPFEAVLLERERSASGEAGLEFVEIPMLPWITDNRQALDKLAALVRSRKGRYYVHCYLGRHRADLARYTILEIEGQPRRVPAPIALPARFERGVVTRLSDTLIIGPLPTDEEWIEFVMRSGTRHVVCLLDPADTAERAMIEQERETARNLGIDFHLAEADDEGAADSTLAMIRALDGAIYVHAYAPDRRTDWIATRAGR
jgi:protein tyrosine phosphatase (PTP) superfamily phosphohydrolase (DUF442 family)